MSRYLSPLLLLIGLSAPAFGCLNDYTPNVAAIERSRTVLEQIQQHVEKEPWPARRDRLRKELGGGGDYRVKNDLANALAHTGEAAEAVKLLEQIEAEKPGLYATASNLGTVCELAGNYNQALEWIRKGIERNPDSHEGTEWLHVRILEAKLSMGGDPRWLDTHPFLGRLPNQDNEISATGNRGEKLTSDQIKAALIYQLHERLQFVKPPDPFVGVLLVNLGELVGKEKTGIGGGLGIFNLARSYLDGTLDWGMRADNDWFRADMAHRSSKGSFDAGGFAFFLLCAFVFALLVIVVKRRIEKRSVGGKGGSFPTDRSGTKRIAGEQSTS